MLKKKKRDISQLGMQLFSQVSTVKRSVRWLITRKSQAMLHLQGIEELIEKVFKECLGLLILCKLSDKARKKIFCTLVFQQKNKWMTFLDKLSSSQDQSSLVTLLFQILVLELISKEKDCRHYWTDAFKALSEKLSSHTETVSVDLDSSLLNKSSKKLEDGSQFLTKTMTQMKQKNLQTTCSPLSMSSVVDKWDAEVIKSKKIKFKSIKIKIFPTPTQKRILNNIFDIERSVYNKANQLIKNKEFHYTDWKGLRNLLVTETTSCLSDEYKTLETQRKSLNTTDPGYLESLEQINLEKERLVKTKNPFIPAHELLVHKDIRTCAVKNLCAAYKTAHSNFKAGNIRFFNISYKKKSSPTKCAEVTSACVSMKNGKIRLCPRKIGEENCEFRISKRNIKKYGKMKIDHNCDILYKGGNYFFVLAIPINSIEEESFGGGICGVDPGLRTFMTCYSSEKIYEYTHNRDLIKKLNKKITLLKNLRKRRHLLKREKKNLRIKRRHLLKIEKKRENVVDSMHWCVINSVIKDNKYILYGNIKSHDIVKGGFNKSNNVEFNSLKFWQFKERLKYKCNIKNIFFKEVDERNTSKCCSSCGNLEHGLKASQVYNCNRCGLKIGRDINAAKNIYMKGLLLTK